MTTSIPAADLQAGQNVRLPGIGPARIIRAEGHRPGLPADRIRIIVAETEGAETFGPEWPIDIPASRPMELTEPATA